MIYLVRKFIVDNNALAQIGRLRRSSGFFRENARIPEEVLYEAREFPDHKELASLKYKTSVTVLKNVRRIMAELEVGDTRLVDLYANKGGADPFVVACAIDAQNQLGSPLIPDRWNVVTNDNAVSALAKQCEIEVINAASFRELIDENTSS